MKKFKLDHFAIGNTLSQTLCLYKHIVSNNINISEIEVHYKNDINKNCAYCIPGITQKQVKPIDGSSYEKFSSSWTKMKEIPYVYLEVPKWFTPKFKVNKKSIVIQPREKSGFGGNHYNNHQVERFVDVFPFHKLATKYAELGYQIFHCGDSNTKLFPKHKNIIELPLIKNKTLLDDFYAVEHSAVVLGTESAMNVAGLCFNTQTIHSNSCHPHSDWWMGDINLTKKLIYKKTKKQLSNKEIINKWGKQGIHHFFHKIKNDYELLNNSYEELDESIQKLLNNDKEINTQF